MSRRRNLLGVVAGLAAALQITAAKGVHTADTLSSSAGAVPFASAWQTYQPYRHPRLSVHPGTD